MEKSAPARQSSYVMYNLCNNKTFYRKTFKGVISCIKIKNINKS